MQVFFYGCTQARRIRLCGPIKVSSEAVCRTRLSVSQKRSSSSSIIEEKIGLGMERDKKCRDTLGLRRVIV